MATNSRGRFLTMLATAVLTVYSHLQAMPTVGTTPAEPAALDLKERPDLNRVAPADFLERTALLGVPEDRARRVLALRSLLGYFEAPGQVFLLPGIGRRWAEMITLHFHITAEPHPAADLIPDAAGLHDGGAADPQAERAALETAEHERAWLAAPLDLNNATPESLLTLPFLDEGLAARIVSRRKRRSFTARWELLAVRGIDPELYRQLRPFVSVEPPGTTDRLRGSWSLQAAESLPGNTADRRYAAAATFSGWRVEVAGRNGNGRTPAMVLARHGTGFLPEWTLGMYRLKSGQGLLFGSSWGAPGGPIRPGGILSGGTPGPGRLWGAAARLESGVLAWLAFVSCHRMDWPADGRARLSTLAERETRPFFVLPETASLRETIAGGELRFSGSGAGDSVGLRFFGTGFSRAIHAPERADLYHEFAGQTLWQGGIDATWGLGPVRLAGEWAVSRAPASGEAGPDGPRFVPALLLAATGRFAGFAVQAFWLERQAGFQAPHGAFPDASGTSRRSLSLAARPLRGLAIEGTLVSETRLWQGAHEPLPRLRHRAETKISLPLGGGLTCQVQARATDAGTDDGVSGKRSLRGSIGWEDDGISLLASAGFAADGAQSGHSFLLRGRLAVLAGLSLRAGFVAHRANHAGFAAYASEERLPGEAGFPRLLYGDGTRLSLALVSTLKEGLRGGVRATLWSRRPRPAGTTENVLADERRSIACFLEGGF